MAIGLLLAIALGLAVGTGNWQRLTYVAIAIAGAIYVIRYINATWKLSLLLCFLDFNYRPGNFDLSPVEVTAVLAFLMALIFSWQKMQRTQPAILVESGIGALNLVLLTWIIYVGIHLFYNVKDPFIPAFFSFSNAIKSYFRLFAPVAILWYFLRRPALVVTKPDFLNSICKLCTVGLVFNIFVRIWAILIGGSDVDPIAGTSLGPTVFRIPFINATDNGYALRELGPFSVLIGACILTGLSRSSRKTRRLGSFLLVAGFAGSVISAGRATLILSICYLVITLAIRKKWAAIIAGFVGIALLVTFINVFSAFINDSTNIFLQRSLQMLMINKGEAANSISSSSDWRLELFNRALNEWRSDHRIFWFGRATYGYSEEDDIAVEIYGGFDARMDSSLRRGATHNLITDLLVAYGLVGAVIYYSVIATLISFLWRLWRRATALLGPIQDLSLALLIYSLGYIFVANVGGGDFPIELTWLLIVLVAAICHRLQPLMPAVTRAFLPFQGPRQADPLALGRRP